MIYLERSPSRILQPFVQLLWCLELDKAAGFGDVERIAPGGILELVFHYREPMQMRYAGEPFVPQPRSSIVSQTRRFVEIRPGGGTGLVSVRFRPWGAHHFVRPRVSELADRVADARDIWGVSAIAEMEERLAEAPDPKRRFSLVEKFLIDQLRRYSKEDVEGVVREVWRRGGQVRIANLCRELGVAERTLERIFGSALGMSPKAYSRVARFLRACAMLRRGDFNSLADVGLRCGYYDQSHFSGEFRA